MIKFVIFLIFTFTLTISAEQIKVALLGDKNLVDLATVELSSEDNIELLERSEIDKVLTEHRLNSSNLSIGVLANYFPHSDIIALISTERLVVFNAKNGFRLWDNKSENIAQNIKSAIQKSTAANPIYLSIVSIRNVGVSSSLNEELDKFITTFEQNLITKPNVQMLERTHLERVMRERNLTKKEFNLVPSAHLLTLEFEPGSNANEVNVKLIVRDLNSNVIDNISENNLFIHIEYSVNNLINKLYKNQLIQPNILSDKQKEAQRFFDEFKSATSYEEKLTKLNAALALGPMNEQFRYEQLKFGRRMGSKEQQLERVMKFKQLYSDYRKDFPNEKKPFLCFLLLDHDIKISTLTTPQKKIMADYYRSIENCFTYEFKLINYFDLNNGLQDKKEYKNYLYYISCLESIYPYYGVDETYKKQYENIKKLYAIDEKLLPNRPELSRGHGYYHNGIQIMIDDFFIFKIGNFNYKKDYKTYLDYIQSINDYSLQLQKSPLMGAKITGVVLETFNRVSREKNSDNLKYIYHEMFEKISVIDKNFVKGIDNYRFGFSDIFRDLEGYSFPNKKPNQLIVNEEFELFLKKQKLTKNFSITDFKELVFKSFKESKSLEQIADNTKILKKFQKQQLFNTKLTISFQRLSQIIFSKNSNKINTSAGERIFKELNSSFDVQLMPFNKGSNCVGFYNYNNELYLLLEKENRDISIVNFSLKENFINVTEVPNFKKIGNFDFISRSNQCFYIDINDDFLVVAGKSEIFSLNLKTQKSQRFSNLWSNWDISGVAVIKDKIYFVATEDRHKSYSKIMLGSIRVDGTQNKIIFHSNRSEKQSSLDSITHGKIPCFNRLNNNQILLQLKTATQTSISSYREATNKLWLFHPNDETFELVLDKIPVIGDINLFQKLNNNHVLLTTFCSTIELNLTTKKILKKYDLSKINCNYMKFFIDKNFLWSHFGSIGVINLENPQDSPALFLPYEIIGVTKKEDTIFYIGERYLISVKEKDKR